MSTPRLLIAYDGSPNAKHAVDAAAALFPGARAVVFYARQPMESFAAHLQGHPALEKLDEIDRAAFDASEAIAAGGAVLAEAKGLTAEPLVSSTVATASEAIIDAADELDIELIVIGSRGQRGMRATVLGSTSTNVLHHTAHPTLVIPSDAVARARYAQRAAVA
ncbi:universal stress protein [Microbacterium sp. JZ31]|uniref:universal stress protein n=1 Tax=Microbacterium sp. JZ31 TaxID=1906274 RepID=UPI001934A228|nr:universal stress protein [Microbacterium sp. JZ31]